MTLEELTERCEGEIRKEFAASPASRLEIAQGTCVIVAGLCIEYAQSCGEFGHADVEPLMKLLTVSYEGNTPKLFATGKEMLAKIKSNALVDAIAASVRESAWSTLAKLEARRRRGEIESWTIESNGDVTETRSTSPSPPGSGS